MRWFFRQCKIPWIGGLKDVLDHTLIFVSAINFVLIGVTAHEVVVIRHLPWLRLWMFFGILILVVVIGMCFVYKFLLPSYYAFRAKQYGHIAKLDAILAKLEEKEKREDE
ncbi:MAG: hypothetical protein DDT40_01752 [candidate division WS2 bacterium]|nr:hypothetical protein [Candidatus Psychracetigena formicireducens]